MRFVVRLNARYFRQEAGVGRYVGAARQQWQFVFLYNVVCVCKKEIAVGLDVYGAAVFQETPVPLKKERGCHALACPLHLGVAESKPQFIHFVGSEQLVDVFNLGAEKCHIVEPVFKSLCGACPHARPFYVDSYVVALGILFAKGNGIFPSSAAEFKYKRVGVREGFLVPAALQRAAS